MLQDRSVVHEVETLDGSCYSSVTFSDDYTVLFVATLNGFIISVDTVSYFTILNSKLINRLCSLAVK